MKLADVRIADTIPTPEEIRAVIEREFANWGKPHRQDIIMSPKEFARWSKWCEANGFDPETGNKL